jgi:hypothetical protein
MYQNRPLSTICLLLISFEGSKAVTGQHVTLEISSKYEAVQIILTNDVAKELELSIDQKESIVSILQFEKRKSVNHASVHKGSRRATEAETVDRVNRLQKEVGSVFDSISGCLLPHQRTRLDQILAQRSARFGSDMTFGIRNAKLNLDLSSDQITRVEETSKSLSAAFAQDFRKSFDDFTSSILSARTQQLENLTPLQRSMYKSTFGEPFVAEMDAINRMDAALLKEKMRLPYPETNSKYTWVQFCTDESDLSLIPNAFGLLNQPGVAEQLELTDEQLAQAKIAVANYGDVLRKANDSHLEHSAGISNVTFELDQLTLILPFQFQKLKEIHRQREVSMMQDSYFGLKSCVDFLELKPEQMKDIDETADEIDKNLSARCTAIRGELEDKLVKYQKKQISLLTPKQKRVYESFFGELFLGSNLIYQSPHPKLLQKKMGQK